MVKKSYNTLWHIFMKYFFKLFIGIAISLFPIAHEGLATERDSAKGKALYVKHCEVCHGLSGKGDGYLFFDPPVANLTSPAIQRKSDDELWQSVHDGVSNTAMGTWKFVLSDAEISLVLAYVRSLGQ